MLWRKRSSELENPVASSDRLSYVELRRAHEEIINDRCVSGGARSGSNCQRWFHYTWRFFHTRRLLTRYVGRGTKSPKAEYTAVFIPNSAEG